MIAVLLLITIVIWCIVHYVKEVCKFTVIEKMDDRTTFVNDIEDIEYEDYTFYKYKYYILQLANGLKKPSYTLIEKNDHVNCNAFNKQNVAVVRIALLYTNVNDTIYKDSSGDEVSRLHCPPVEVFCIKNCIVYLGMYISLLKLIKNGGKI